MLDHVLELVEKVLQETLYRPGRRITECADRMPFDLVRDRQQQVEVIRSALTVDDSRQHPMQPAGALAARRALPAGPARGDCIRHAP